VKCKKSKLPYYLQIMQINQYIWPIKNKCQIMFSLLISFAYKAIFWNHNHSTKPIEQFLNDLHPKHVVECVGEDDFKI